jgi:hypothetical protein
MRKSIVRLVFVVSSFIALAFASGADVKVGW